MFRVVLGALLLVVLTNLNAMRGTSSQFFPLQQSSHLSLSDNDSGRTRVVALYRGINFCSDIFRTEQARNDYINSHVPGENVLESLHINRTTQWILKYNADHDIDISAEAVRQHQVFNSNFMFQHILKRNIIRNNMVLRGTYYRNYHKDYSNHYSSNSGHFNLNQYDTQFVANPFLSFSKSAKHAIKYAYGVNKAYAGHSSLTAKYARNGRLQIDTVGVVQVVFVKEEDLLKLGVCDVNEEIGRPWRRISNENEVSLDGCVFPENFVLQIGARLPSLTEKSHDCNQLGLYKGHWRSKLTKDREDCARCVEKRMVSHLEDFINDRVSQLAEENGMELVQLEDLRRN